MKREARILLTKATDSVLLGIEHFNRPWDRGRHEAILVLTDRAFELLLKSIIVHKGGRIREPRAKETIGFGVCVRKCQTDAQVKCLTEEEAVTIQIINGLRDAAQHYIIDISEQQLYTYIQSGLTLFDKLLRKVFDQKLTDYLPERVLPISSNPPKDFGELMDIEFEDTKRLVIPRARKKFEARTKLRSLAIVEASLDGIHSQPSERELEKLVSRVSTGENWQDIFPGINRLVLSTDDNGVSVTLRVTQSRGEPIQLVPEGTPGATVVAVKRVDELGFYSLNMNALIKKTGLSQQKLLALFIELKIQEDIECFKEIIIGRSHFKRYSPKALARINKALPSINWEEVLGRYKSSKPRKHSAI